MIKVEYVWVDGCEPWGMRSKVKVFEPNDDQSVRLSSFDVSAIPQWSFDGSSTAQAEAEDSDCILDPVRIFLDPLGAYDYIVLCEVLDSKGDPHITNTRSQLFDIAKSCEDQEPSFGFEQEYFLTVSGKPLGFPAEGYPEPQGIYYCSAGNDRAFGRGVADTHMQACIDAGLSITGTNAEVAPGQWEYQIGGPDCGPVEASDQLWLSRWLLIKTAEAYDITVSFDPKPVEGDWNGSGCHTNFSTLKMREPGGISHIEAACEKLSRNIDRHIASYGEGLDRRLTGKHETANINTFSWGVADRTASIRIPSPVKVTECGYLEDRRPNSNCDPYRVATSLLLTICIS